MREIFLIILNQLNTVPGIAWVDKDKGQIDRYVDKPSIPFPCYLIKIAVNLSETVAAGIQRCQGTVTIRTASDLAVSETAAAAPQTAINNSLQYFDYVDAAFDKLQSYTDGEIELIERVSCIEEDRRDGLTVVKTTFAIYFEERAD